MATKKTKRKCSSCGGYCGGTKRTGCKFAANAEKLRADALWAYATGGNAGQSALDNEPVHGCGHMQGRGAA